MALNKNEKLAKRDLGLIETRRRLVAQLLVRGRYSQRQIQRAIVGEDGKTVPEGGRNPDTGKMWAIGTIHNDIIALEKEWRAEALKDVDVHKARVLAEIRAVRAAAWMLPGVMFADGLRIVLRTLKQESDLLGLEAPKELKLDITERIRELAKAEGIDPDEAVREAERIMEGLT